MNEDQWALKAAEWKPYWSKNVCRNAGRPKRRWSDDIASFLIDNDKPCDLLVAARDVAMWTELEDAYAKLPCANARP